MSSKRSVFIELSAIAAIYRDENGGAAWGDNPVAIIPRRGALHMVATIADAGHPLFVFSAGSPPFLKWAAENLHIPVGSRSLISLQAPPTREGMQSAAGIPPDAHPNTLRAHGPLVVGTQRYPRNLAEFHESAAGKISAILGTPLSNYINVGPAPHLITVPESTQLSLGAVRLQNALAIEFPQRGRDHEIRIPRPDMTVEAPAR